MSEFIILSRNMNRHSKTSWEYVSSIPGLDIVLLQEATPPPLGSGWQCEPRPEADHWRIAYPHDMAPQRGYRSAVAARRGLPIRPIVFKPIAEAGSRVLTQSHPGQFSAAEVQLSENFALTVVSLYGLWEYPYGDGEQFSDASIHRAISDLTPLFDGRPLLLAGDLNIWHGYGQWRARYESVFSRLDALGLNFVGPFRTESDPLLDKCPCRSKECRHVVTYRHNRKLDGIPYQNDFAFATKTLIPMLKVSTVTADETWVHSDHVPIHIRVKVPSEP